MDREILHIVPSTWNKGQGTKASFSKKHGHEGRSTCYKILKYMLAERDLILPVRTKVNPTLVSISVLLTFSLASEVPAHFEIQN